VVGCAVVGTNNQGLARWTRETWVATALAIWQANSVEVAVVWASLLVAARTSIALLALAIATNSLLSWNEGLGKAISVVAASLARDGHVAVGPAKACVANTLSIDKVALTTASAVDSTASTSVRSLTKTLVVLTHTVTCAVIGAESVQATDSGETVSALARHQERINARADTTARAVQGTLARAVDTSETGFALATSSNRAFDADHTLAQSVARAAIRAGEVLDVDLSCDVGGGWICGQMSRSMRAVMAS